LQVTDRDRQTVAASRLQPQEKATGENYKNIHQKKANSETCVHLVRDYSFHHRLITLILLFVITVAEPGYLVGGSDLTKVDHFSSP